MTPERFDELTGRLGDLRAVVVGDFCLDRYFDLKPLSGETSIETGLPVLHVDEVRNQPGGAGTIVSNLSSLGVGSILPIGFTGTDGEGFELCRALEATPHVSTELFFQTEERRAFTYLKPMLPGESSGPEEMSRIDIKNDTETPLAVREQLRQLIRGAVADADILILLSQVDLPGTGVLHSDVLAELFRLRSHYADAVALGDSRSGFEAWPSVSLKMNRAELEQIRGENYDSEEQLEEDLAAFAKDLGQSVYVTLSDDGFIAADADGDLCSASAFPVYGEIDVVGAGDAVTASLASALKAGATTKEALDFSMAAASSVLHQVGTTGQAKLREMKQLLCPNL